MSGRSGARLDAVEKYNVFNSLVSVPMALVGWNTLVDLHNNCTVAGTVDDVDGYMNITMTHAVLVDQRLRQHAFSTFHIQARNIRLLHVPEQFRVTEEVQRLLERMGGGGRRKPRQQQDAMRRTFKVKRATARQQETLRELAAAERATAAAADAAAPGGSG